MAASCIGIRSSASSTIIVLLVAFLVLLAAAGVVGIGNGTQVGFRSGEELLGWQRIEAQLARVRNASVKTIQSPDGDVIDCVPTHLQPAFEHPKLRGQKPESEPVERPRIASAVHGHGHADAAAMEGDGKEQGLQQTWTRSGESCPEGTIPVRWTTEDDVRTAGSVRRFGMKARSSYGLAQQEPPRL